MACCLFCCGVSFSFHLITLLKFRVTLLNALMHIEKNVDAIAATLVTTGV